MPFSRFRKRNVFFFEPLCNKEVVWGFPPPCVARGLSCCDIWCLTAFSAVVRPVWVGGCPFSFRASDSTPRKVRPPATARARRDMDCSASTIEPLVWNGGAIYLKDSQALRLGKELNFPRISSPFCFCCFFGIPLFSTIQAKKIYIYIYFLLGS